MMTQLKQLHFLKDSPLLSVFCQVELERLRSESIYGNWATYTPRACHAAIACEVGEVLLAIELGDIADAQVECIHTMNTAAKAYLRMSQGII